MRCILLVVNIFYLFIFVIKIIYFIIYIAIQDINLDLLKHYMNNPDVKDIVSEVARVASRGDFKLTFSYYSNFAK